MLDIETRNALKAMEDMINDNIDHLIQSRNAAKAAIDRDAEQLVVDNKKAAIYRDYRYVTKKLEHALGMVHKAEERANDE